VKRLDENALLQQQVKISRAAFVKLQLQKALVAQLVRAAVGSLTSIG